MGQRASHSKGAAFAIGVIAMTVAAACATSLSSGHPSTARSSAKPSALPPPTLPALADPITLSDPPTSSSSTPTPTLPPPSTSMTPSPSPTPTTPSASVVLAGAKGQLPLGGRTILGHYRLVAFYGGPNGPGLGVLGSASPDVIADKIETRAKQFDGYGLPVQPAMELITTVAQGGPGPDGLYSKPIPLATVEGYLAAAHRHHMLLILDFQPGRGEFLPQVQEFADVIADPSVEVALDPEWKMGPTQVPGTVIGSASAASVDVVRNYLSTLIARVHLPDKLLLVHEFTNTMLPDRSKITPRKGVEIVFHADGFGAQKAKLNTWHGLAFPGRPYGTGFKLFLTQDTNMMSPAQVMSLRPRPDIITYQ